MRSFWYRARRFAPSSAKKAGLRRQHVPVSFYAIIAAIVWVSFASGASAFNRTETCDQDPASAFACEENETPIPIAWAENCIPYRLSNRIAEDGPVGAAIRAAFDTWTEVECSSLTFQYAGTTDQRDIGFDGVFGDEGNFNITIFRNNWGERNSRIVGLTSVSYGTSTGRIYDADIEFNAEFFDFDILERSSSLTTVMDIQNVATHEVGHMLGLDHASEETLVGEQSLFDTTMFVQTFPGEIRRRSLEADDIAGVCAIYPTSDRPIDACEPVEPDFVEGPVGFVSGRAATGSNGCGCSTGGFAQSGFAWPLIGLLTLIVRMRRRDTAIDSVDVLRPSASGQE